MRSRTPLTSWLDAQQPHLAERWSMTLNRQLARLLGYVAEPAVQGQAQGLLLSLAELMDQPLTTSDPDDRLGSVLRLVRALEADLHLSKAEIVLLLFTLRDTLESTLVGDAALVDGHGVDSDTDIAELGSLLGRLGLVFLEAGNGLAGAAQVPADSNLDYALRYERARQMAITDSLTGLSNFGYFRERLAEEQRRAERYQRLLSLIIFDLDHFKQYNDKYGHPAGNEVLKRVATILRREARETDLAARYGGEELVLLLPEANRRTAWDVAERIRHCVADTGFDTPLDGSTEHVTLSAGVATFPVDAVSDEALVARADESLYLAKSQGRNRIVAHQPAHRTKLVYQPERWVEAVALVGSFNNWDKQADPMRRREDGAFEFVIALAPGDYRYKFVLNGTAWTPDPANAQTQPDNMGGVNSVLRILG